MNQGMVEENLCNFMKYEIIEYIWTNISINIH